MLCEWKKHRNRIEKPISKGQAYGSVRHEKIHIFCHGKPDQRCKRQHILAVQLGDYIGQLCINHLLNTFLYIILL